MNKENFNGKVYTTRFKCFCYLTHITASNRTLDMMESIFTDDGSLSVGHKILREKDNNQVLNKEVLYSSLAIQSTKK